MGAGAEAGQPLHFPGPGECRCEVLRSVFGIAGAPAMCAACAVAKRHAELWDAGYVRVEQVYRQAFLDCGVAVETITSDHTCWVPCWAEQLREALWMTKTLGPVLVRASCDPVFLDAAMTVIAMVDVRYEKLQATGYAVSEYKQELHSKLRSFAVGQGVEIP